MGDRIDMVVIGAGQAGLAVSRGLGRAGVAHAVLEKERVAQTWRGRWDSFCLVTPNWSVQLPGHRYDGQDPDGFLPRDEVVAFLERYATGFQAPVREGVEVTSVDPGEEGHPRKTYRAIPSLSITRSLASPLSRSPT
jgi:putative flavoprotein involved in K+ transport